MRAELQVEAWISAVGIAVLVLALIVVARNPELATVTAVELDELAALL